jgi:hypothetical protein
MSTLSELQKKLQQESQGIMFPFSAATSAVNTTQQVYDSSTDGIMTMTGKKYVGPNAVIQYGTEAQGYPRQLKQIEAPMLPQVSNLPPQGTGIMENAPGTTVPDPITETPVEQPTVNPCPSGYQLVNGVCQLIPQRNDKNEQPTFNNKPRNIGNTAKTASSISAAIQDQGGTGNFGETLNITLDNNNFLSKLPPVGIIATVLSTIGKFVKGFEDKRDLGFGKTEGNNIYNIEGGADTISTDGINVTKNKDGTLNAAITQKGKTQFGDIITSESMQGNLASTQATDKNGSIITAPNGQKQIVGPLTLGLGTTGSEDSYYGIQGPSRNAPTAEERRKANEEANKGKPPPTGIVRPGDPSPETVKTVETVEDVKSKNNFGEMGVGFGKLKSTLNTITDNLSNIENQIKNVDGNYSKYELLQFGKQETKLNEEKRKLENAINKITEYEKQTIEELEKATDEAQEQGFKDTQEQLEYREKAAKEANKRAEGKRASQSQFKGGKDYKGGATATGTTSCFHPDTDVNGKKIKDIKAGDYINDSLVEGMVQFKMNNPYYLIDDIKVSGSHGVLHNNKWIFVADHPESKEVKDITEFVYVPIVKGGTFKINNTTYADYDYHDIVVLGDDEWKKRRGFK